MRTHFIPLLRKSKKGSLLLEVLLSIILLSTGITVIIQAMTSGLRAMAHSAQYTKIANALENEMVGLIFTNLRGDILPDVSRDVQTEKHYTVSSQSELLNDSHHEHIQDVRLNVSWFSNRKNSQASINTYFIEGLSP